MTDMTLEFSRTELPVGGEASIVIVPLFRGRVRGVSIPTDVGRKVAITFVGAGGRSYPHHVPDPPPSGLVFRPRDSQRGDQLADVVCEMGHTLELRLRNVSPEPVRVSDCYAVLVHEKSPVPGSGSVYSTRGDWGGVWPEGYDHLNCDFAEVDLSPGGAATIAFVPPFDCRPSDIILPADIAGKMVIDFIGVGGAPQLAGPGPIPARCFSEVAERGVGARFDVCKAKHAFEVRLRNVSGETIHVSGCRAVVRKP